jgi:PAS domain S-box-containing protein
MNQTTRGSELSAEEELRATVELLEIANRSSGTEDLMRKTLAFMQDLSGCEAAGIRLKRGDDYPYYVVRGFPEEFVLAENSLCSRGTEGQILRDDIGDPILECMCGNIIRGRFDPSLPFFTEKGSFWSNCTTELLASTTEEDRQARTRNRCNGEGYESVALIPLRLGQARYGLIQLDDRARDAFSPRKIALYERLADSVSSALAEMLAKDDLRESEERYKIIIRGSMDGFLEADSKNGRILDVNEAYCVMTGYTRERLLAMDIEDIDATRPSPRTLERHAERMALTGWERFESKHRRADGSAFDVEVSSYRMPGRGRFLCFIRDITRRREAQSRIESLLKEKDVLFREVQHRVKNNLNAMQSLLSIQAAHAKDSAAAAVLADAQSRLGSMGLLYDMLYRSDEVERLSLNAYLPALVQQVAATFPNRDSVSVETVAEDIVLPVKVLSTIGILVNELITNAMKHAFEGREGGRLRVSAAKAGERVLIKVEDDGKGMPEGRDPGAGLGLKLARLLAQQIDASISIEGGKGTKVALEFSP